MFLINKFDLENLTEEQLQILGNFSKLYSDIKAMKAAEKIRENERLLHPNAKPKVEKSNEILDITTDFDVSTNSPGSRLLHQAGANSRLSVNDRPESTLKFENLNKSIKIQLNSLQATSSEVMTLLKSGKISNLVGLIKHFQQETLTEINNRTQQRHLNNLRKKHQKL